MYSIYLYCGCGRIDILELIYCLEWLHTLLFRLFLDISVSRRSRDLNNISEIFPRLHCIHLYSHYKRNNTFKLKYFFQYFILHCTKTPTLSLPRSHIWDRAVWPQKATFSVKKIKITVIFAHCPLKSNCPMNFTKKKNLGANGLKQRYTLQTYFRYY